MHGGGGYGGMHGGYNGGIYGGYGGIRGNPIVLGNGSYPVNRAYLNTQIMPNISRSYWEYPDYGYDFQYIPEYVPVIKNPPFNIIPQEEIKIEQLSNKESKDNVLVEVEEEKPKKKKKCNKNKNKNIVSKQILWSIIILLLIIILGFIFKMYYNK